MKYVVTRFGRSLSRDGGDEFIRLELAISDDKQRVVLSERRFSEGRLAGQVGMMKDEVLELMRLLGREFVLDDLARI